MADHASAKKAARQALRRQARNVSAISRYKSAVKKLRAGIAAKVDKKQAMALLDEAQSILMSTARKGILKSKTASRYVSRLSQAVHRLGA